MKKFLKYSVIVLLVSVFTGCETMDDPEVETSPIYPLAGEWLVHVYDANGVAFGATAENPLGTLFALRSYNTADNSSSQLWLRMGTTQPVAIRGKANCDVGQRTISGESIANDLFPNATFSISEGKVLIGGTKLEAGSGVVTDSIVVTYTTSVDGATYTARGHRVTGWLADNY